jgi:hypothetical protein
MATEPIKFLKYRAGRLARTKTPSLMTKPSLSSFWRVRARTMPPVRLRGFASNRPASALERQHVRVFAKNLDKNV